MSERQQIYKGTETAPTLYINSVQIGQSQFDLRLIMGVLEEANDERVVTRVNVAVYMTIQHAKIFAGLLNKQLEKFEEANGPIVLPKLPQP